MYEVYCTYSYSITSKVKHRLEILFLVYRLEYLGKELIAEKMTDKILHRISLSMFAYSTLLLVTALIFNYDFVSFDPMISLVVFGSFYFIAGLLYFMSMDLFFRTSVKILEDHTQVKTSSYTQSRDFSISEYSKITLNESLGARLAATWEVHLVTKRKYIRIYRGKSQDFATRVTNTIAPVMNLPIETHLEKNKTKKKVYQITGYYFSLYFLPIPFMILFPSVIRFLLFYFIIGIPICFILLFASMHYIDK